MTVLAAVLGALAGGTGLAPSRPASRRLRAAGWRDPTPVVVESQVTANPEGVGHPVRSWSVRRLFVAAVVLSAGVLAVGGLAGLILGAVGTAVVVLVRPAGRPATVNPDEVPVVVDLMAGCLEVGASLAAALEAAAVAGDPVIQAACRMVASALRAGSPGEEAWRSWLEDPWLAPVARTAVRTTVSGAGAAADFRRTASRLRARRRAQAQRRVHQASVWLVAPLGLCFLPAFVLVAVVPLVIGLIPSLR